MGIPSLIIKGRTYIMKKNNTKKTTMKAVEGRLVSAALGIAAGIALIPSSGKKFGSDVQKKSAQFHAYLAPRAKKLKKIGKESYDLFVTDSAKKFAKAKRLSEKEGTALATHAKKSWKHIAKHAA